MRVGTCLSPLIPKVDLPQGNQRANDRFVSRLCQRKKPDEKFKSPKSTWASCTVRRPSADTTERRSTIRSMRPGLLLKITLPSESLLKSICIPRTENTSLKGWALLPVLAWFQPRMSMNSLIKESVSAAHSAVANMGKSSVLQ